MHLQKSRTQGLTRGRHAFYYLMIVLFFAFILANILPSGAFTRETVDGITKVDPNSYRVTEKVYATIPMFFESFYYGVVNTASLMALMFFVGFGFQVLTEIKLIETAIFKLTKSLKNVPFVVVVIILFAAFEVVNWFTGLYDLGIVFIPMVVPLCLALGYDVMTGAAIVLVAECIGFAAAPANPWFGGIAQPIAELPLYSGFGYRVICSLVLSVPGILFVSRYAAKVKKNPELSVLKDINLPYKAVDESEELKWSPRLILAGVVFLGIFGYMIYGSLKLGFSYLELTACFTAIGLLCSVVMGVNLEEICRKMERGMRTMFMAAMVMLFARSVLWLLTETQVIDTVIYGLSFLVRGLPVWLSAIMMFIVQTIINFFVPSGSGQAALTMPIMVPLADMAGLNRQIACLASQFGDGFSNFMWPTVGSFIAILAGTGIPYQKWAKWFLPLFLIITGCAFVLLVVAVAINLGPF